MFLLREFSKVPKDFYLYNYGIKIGLVKRLIN